MDDFDDFMDDFGDSLGIDVDGTPVHSVTPSGSGLNFNQPNQRNSWDDDDESSKVLMISLSFH